PNVRTPLFTPFISRNLIATKAKGRAAEWAGAAGTLVVAVVAAGPVAEVDGRAEVAEVGAVPAEANVIPRSRAPMARKFSSGFPKKRVDVFLKSLRSKPSARSTTAL